MHVDCPPVSNDGTSNQHSCSAERPSIGGCITAMAMMQNLAACPSGKLGSTSSPAAPRVPPGFAPEQLVNSLGREPWACPLSPLQINSQTRQGSIHPSIQPTMRGTPPHQPTRLHHCLVAIQPSPETTKQTSLTNLLVHPNANLTTDTWRPSTDQPKE